jgi:hypothetical protein
LRDEFLRHPPNRVTRDLDLALNDLESLAAAMPNAAPTSKDRQGSRSAVEA